MPTGEKENNMELWFIGTALDDGRWMVEGAFITEAEAAKAAKHDEFILLAELGRLPAVATDAKKSTGRNRRNGNKASCSA